MSDEPLQVVGIAGSLRPGSFNRALLRAAVELAPDRLEIAAHDIDGIPLYRAPLDEDGERPEAVEALKRAISEADGLLVATPEYNFGVPGVLRNTLDWMSRPGYASPLTHKPTGMMGAAPGGGGTMRAQQQLKTDLLSMACSVYPHAGVAVTRCKEKFDDEGKLTDDATRKFLARYLGGFAAWVEATRGLEAPAK